MHVGFHVGRICNDADCTINEASSDAVERLLDAGIVNPCVQVFVTNPRNGKPIDDISDYSPTIRTYIHGSYVDSPWKSRTHLLREELRICENMGAYGVIVHLSAGASMEKLEKVLTDDIHARVWLEINSAKPSADTFETPEKLHALFGDVTPTHVGLCIDTAHLFACGVSLSSYKNAETWLRELQFLLPKVPKLVHLNDTSAELGSGKDIHENLFTGNIWGHYKKRKHESGVVAILEWCERNGYDVIVERGSGSDITDIHEIVKLGFGVQLGV